MYAKLIVFHSNNRVSSTQFLSTRVGLQNYFVQRLSLLVDYSKPLLTFGRYQREHCGTERTVHRKLLLPKRESLSGILQIYVNAPTSF